MRDAAEILLSSSKSEAVTLHVVEKAKWPDTLKRGPSTLKALAKSMGFEAAPLALLFVPNAKGEVADIYVGAPAADADPFALGSIATKLPPGHYCFKTAPKQAGLVALGWCLELYRYDPYRKAEARAVTLVCPDGVNRTDILNAADASFWVRDMINAPANLMGPDELEGEARNLAKAHKAQMTVVKGKELAKEFPLIHVVGAASPRLPRLIDLRWGKASAPKITLVGKGVCFDTGGLDIKPSSGMLLMKKDMGGAANVLGLARMIMAAKLNVRLRVLIPAVENSIAGDAFRPGDVFKTRKGLTVEIGNTDAEGRLVLCEALALADEEKPELLIDMATLTGAARVALGPDLPPYYTNDQKLAAQLATHAEAENDPLWQLPLWKPYFSMIESPIADINNAGAGGFAGSITAALFLKRFVEHAKSYLHLDIFGWVPTSKPGRPKGGEAQAMRALFALLKAQYGI
ncbi:MAG: leucyl aminopeptidase family protein [Alphaproteobacteria bacterium]|nr:leucyl aminopeptidase family protein [Alphaproteobacteria bacterium]